MKFNHLEIETDIIDRPKLLNDIKGLKLTISTTRLLIQKLHIGILDSIFHKVVN